MENSWVDEISKNINNELDNIHKRDAKYYQVDRFIRMAERIHHFEDSCKECKTLKTEIEDISNNLSSYINSLPTGRRNLEKKDERIKKHLKDEHDIHPVYYFVSLYSFIGMFVGIVIGIIIHFIIPDTRLIYSVGIPWFAGLLAGYLKGNKKDWVIRRGKRLL